MVRAADPDMRWQVNEILDTSKAMGLKVLRTWAFSEGPLQYNSLQRYPGACPAPGAAAAPRLATERRHLRHWQRA
jgi:hypothetical protein